jgi:hypothetical protein
VPELSTIQDERDFNKSHIRFLLEEEDTDNHNSNLKALLGLGIAYHPSGRHDRADEVLSEVRQTIEQPLGDRVTPCDPLIFNSQGHAGGPSNVTTVSESPRISTQLLDPSI